MDSIEESSDMKKVKLSDFRPYAPRPWFAQSEWPFATCRGGFQVQQVPIRWRHRTAAPYNSIDQRLLGAHYIIKDEKVEHQYLLPALANRKPSEMLVRDVSARRGEDRVVCLFVPVDVTMVDHGSSLPWTTRTPCCCQGSRCWVDCMSSPRCGCHATLWRLFFPQFTANLPAL